MKKIRLGLIVLIMLICFSLFACNKETKEEKHLNVLLPEGIPSVAIGGLFDDENYKFETVDGAQLLSGALIKGEYDVIIAPIILGAQLYTKSNNKYKLAAVLTTGNSYLVSKKENAISSLKDLEGETIASYGENTAPDIVLKAALVASGVDLSAVTIVYENSVSDAFSNRFAVQNGVKYVLSAEPIITKMEQNKYTDGLSKIDLQAVLHDQISVIPQAGIFVLDNDTDYSSFLYKVKNNVTNLNNNSEEYADKLLNLKSELKRIFEKLTKPVIVNSIPNSNIVYLNALENKTTLDNYFALVNNYNSNILNNNTINTDFYYGK